MDEDRILNAIAEGRREQRQKMVQFRTEVMDKFARVEDRLTEMRDDMIVAMGSATTALRQHKEARVEVLELMERITVIHRQVHRPRTDVDERKKG